MGSSTIILDFDGTAASFRGEKGVWGWFDIFERRGFPLDTINLVYKEVRDGQGFSIGRFMQAISEKTGRRFQRKEQETVREEFGEWLLKHLILFPDTLPVIQSWRARGIPLIIISAGEPSYQLQKIQTVGLPYDQLIIVERTNEKVAKIRILAESHRNPLVVIDDRTDVLDAVRETLGHRATTVWVRREGSEFPDQTPRYEHLEVDSLGHQALERVILWGRRD